MDVGGEVLREVVSAGEALPARLAVVRSLARVDAQVAGQVALAAESSPAEQADEGPLSRVLSDVQFQVLFGADTLAAEGAREAPLSLPVRGVCPQVAQQRRLGRRDSQHGRSQQRTLRVEISGGLLAAVWLQTTASRCLPD